MHFAQHSAYEQLAVDQLRWLPELQLGYYPVSQAPYDQDYFDRYAEMAGTERGEQITAARVELVRRHWGGQVVDIGIGCGQFIGAHGNALGDDINPVGKRWLAERSLQWHGGTVDALTFWDVLEHIHDPGPLLARAATWVFISLPIFEGHAHVQRSRHYRKDEHCWYFTRAGLVRFMGLHGFDLIEESDIETRLGREDIGSFAFRRVC
ncbi:methyltransferase domain-containing protein [Chitiniphilus eburneus]|uniref:methyltransferase domain-containing protein n=1 Tax=Chitiniphilus eburneus TaxID=2571148 RepID=UPI0035CF38B9